MLYVSQLGGMAAKTHGTAAWRHGGKAGGIFATGGTDGTAAQRHGGKVAAMRTGRPPSSARRRLRGVLRGAVGADVPVRRDDSELHRERAPRRPHHRRDDHVLAALQLGWGNRYVQ